ncbi:MAG: bluetail domain-containing putative surface protein, partial [Kovacikia sp.]
SYVLNNPISSIDPSGAFGILIPIAEFVLLNPSVQAAVVPLAIRLAQSAGGPPVFQELYNQTKDITAVDIINKLIEVGDIIDSGNWNTLPELLREIFPPEPPPTTIPDETLDPKPKHEDDTKIIQSQDPNDIIGPAGSGAANWIAKPQLLPYTINFENLATATAPAQEVTITQPLDPDLDPTTTQLQSFGWGNLVFQIPSDQALHFQNRLDFTSSNGYLVDVNADVDIANRQVAWKFTTIDPLTGDLPSDPFLGFLPPTNAEGSGDGFVNYTVRPKQNLQTGDVLDAQATIVFDVNPPLDTAPIFNTIDVGTPSSAVNALPASVTDPNFTVSWSGTDDGSGIATYDIFASVDGSNYQLWLDNTTATSATYNGAAGRTYSFYSVAEDNVGYVEASPTSADATTTVGLVNRPPTLSAVNRSANEDTAIMFTAADFNNAFSDVDGDTLTTVKFTSLPANGTLKLSGVNVSPNVDIAVADLGSLTFTPDANFNGPVSFAWNGSDGKTYATTPAAVNLTLLPVNDAPVLTATNPTLTPINQADTSNPGQTVASFLGTSVTDVDSGAVEGIALTEGTATNGTWQYNTGSGWLNVGSVSASQALLLRDSDQIRFIPSGQNFTNPTLRYRAWDQTSGTAGTKVNITTTGGISAFSSATDIASIAVGTRQLGGNGKDILNGNSGPDYLDGGNGNDSLFGNAGNDTLLGGNGDDLLVGGAGVDNLTGGNGNDTFRYTTLTDSLLEGFDHITDLKIGTDVIDGPNAVSAANLKKLGNVTDLDANTIGNLLSSTNFVTNGAATFTFGTRRLVALNDVVPGFSEKTDAIVEITGFRGNLNNLAIV